MILDSSFLIDLVDDDAGAVAKLDELTERRLTVPTLVYTGVGIGLDQNTPEARRFDAVMDQLPLVPYDAEAARRAVDVQRGLLADGQPIGAVDVIIAGIALARDEPVVTRNVSEFSRTPVRVSPY